MHLGQQNQGEKNLSHQTAPVSGAAHTSETWENLPSRIALCLARGAGLKQGSQEHGNTGMNLGQLFQL